MLNEGMFTSERQNWKTPVKLFRKLNEEFNFDFDPCLADDKANWETNGLLIEWGERNYVNPPYNNLDKWCNKAVGECNKGKLVVMLIPSRTDTKWWHDYVMRADEIRFIKGRLSFDDSKGVAPFPSCLVIFRPNKLKNLQLKDEQEYLFS